MLGFLKRRRRDRLRAAPVPDGWRAIVERNVPLQAHNSFGIVAKARALVRVRGAADVQQLLADAEFGPVPKFVLGGGSNIVLTGDVKPLVLKVEIAGRRVLDDGPRGTIIEAGAGENWHDFVDWTLARGFGGLENLALIPGTVDRIAPDAGPDIAGHARWPHPSAWADLRRHHSHRCI